MLALALFIGVLLGGALGTALRVLLSQQLLPCSPGHFPTGTLLVNLSGSFLIGLLFGTVMFVTGPDLSWHFVVLAYGFLGAYTTVSSLSLELLMMLRAGRSRLALVYLGTSVLGGLGLVMAGLGLMLAWSRISFSW